MNRPRPFGSLLLAAAATLTPIHVQAQNSVSDSSSALPQPAQSSSLPSATPSFHPQTSISLGTFGQFTPTRIEGGAPQFSFGTNGISPSAGVLGTFQQQFRPWLGYSVNMGYTRVTERYTDNASTPFGYDIKLDTNMYELSLSYVTKKQLTPRLSGFAEVGAGTVTFLPVISDSRPAYNGNNSQNRLYYAPVNFRPEGVGGVGLDLHLTGAFSFRAEYRALIYKNPDFGQNLQKSTTLTSEPTVSLTYSFGRK